MSYLGRFSVCIYMCMHSYICVYICICIAWVWRPDIDDACLPGLLLRPHVEMDSHLNPDLINLASHLCGCWGSKLVLLHLVCTFFIHVVIPLVHTSMLSWIFNIHQGISHLCLWFLGWNLNIFFFAYYHSFQISYHKVISYMLALYSLTIHRIECEFLC